MTLDTTRRLLNSGAAIRNSINVRVTKDFLTFCFKAGSVLEKYDICLKAINYSRDINKQAGFESQDRSRLFQFRIALKLFLLGVRLFLKMSNRTVSTLPSSFLFPIIIYHSKVYKL